MDQHAKPHKPAQHNLLHSFTTQYKYTIRDNKANMKSFPSLIFAIVLLLREDIVSGFSSTPLSKRSSPGSSSQLYAAVPNTNNNNQPTKLLNNNNIIQRRTLLSNILTAPSALLFLPTLSNAAEDSSNIPSVTSSEFDVILKDSAKSISIVELSGPKSETAIVKLVDGTTFTISDLVESSTDPRSPLKLVARCRLYKIPVKNTGLISAVSGDGSTISNSGRKKKSYMNPRVQEAEKKEKAKRERMAEDERERLEELYKMEEKEEGFLSEN